MSRKTKNTSTDKIQDTDKFHAIQVGYNRFFIDKRYTNLKPAGDGSYGFVASANDVITNERVAIKKIKDVFAGEDTHTHKHTLYLHIEANIFTHYY